MKHWMQLLKMKTEAVRKFKIYDEDGMPLRVFFRKDQADSFLRLRPDCTLESNIPVFDWKNSECLF